MSEEFTGRFTGTKPTRLDKVIQQFLAKKDAPPVGLEVIRNWISSGSVEIDGAPTRNIEKLIQPGSFLKIRKSG